MYDKYFFFLFCVLVERTLKLLSWVVIWIMIGDIFERESLNCFRKILNDRRIIGELELSWSREKFLLGRDWVFIYFLVILGSNVFIVYRFSYFGCYCFGIEYNFFFFVYSYLYVICFFFGVFLIVYIWFYERI